VEIHNAGEEAVELSGWTLEKFSFPQGFVLPPGGFAVVASEPAAFKKEFGFDPLGPLPGRLKRNGETLRLRDFSGKSVDTVRYSNAFPWPSASSGEGSSLERVNPLLSPDVPSNWRSAGYPVITTASAPLIPLSDGNWRWRPGTSEASAPRDAWRRLEFAEDASWKTARLSLGYGDDDDQTSIPEMQGRFTSVFLRRSFEVSEPAVVGPLVARLRVDDGCILWLNGVEVFRFNVPAGDLPATATSGDHEAGREPEVHPLPAAHTHLRKGTNLLAAQVFNSSINSSDLTFDLELRPLAGAPPTKKPTPGRANSVLSQDCPPAFLEVRHTPESPRSRQGVLVTARAERGLANVTLEYQPVSPGAYIRRKDPAFSGSWAPLPMNDAGRDGDAVAGDGIFSALVPAEEQVHRRLMRYRIRGTAASGLQSFAPREDDSCPNFAWFVNDGPSTYTGAIRPGKSEPLTFSPDFLATLPAYHLLANAEDVANSQWNGGFHRKHFEGTLVVEGKVYDHIGFHSRGQGSAHISGKNKWGLRFDRHHPLAAKRNDGTPYNQAWDSLNLNPGLSTPYIPIFCGIGGLDEALSFRAYQLAGVPTANTHWVQWRVITDARECDPANQFTGDLRGLYLAIQDMDGDWLKELQLPDGNVYSTQSGRKHLARGATSDQSDWHSFLNGVRRDSPETWWRSNLDLNAYFGFHAMNRLLANVDVRPDGNHGYYHNPDGRWAPIPWDLDMMFVPRHHQPGIIDASRCLNVPSIRREYANRAREILDLFCSDSSSTGGQVGQLVHELSRYLQPGAHLHNWTELDAVCWNFHPRKNGHDLYFRQTAAADHFGGRWERKLVTPDFRGFCRYLLDFMTDARTTKNYKPNDGDPLGYGYGYLSHESAEQNIPERPVISPIGNERFRASPFRSPASAQFGVLTWRLAPIGQQKVVAGNAEQFFYELQSDWSVQMKNPAQLELSLPVSLRKSGRTYRLRARFEDKEGRASHWSEPLTLPAL
jgi:hypothetical protein